MILVTGATGHLGNVLLSEIRKRYPGEALRILVLPGERVGPIDGVTAEILCGDIRDPERVREAVTGARLVFHLAGLVEIRAGKEHLLEQVNVHGTRNIVDACLAATDPVPRLVYVSSVHSLPEAKAGEVLSDPEPALESEERKVRLSLATAPAAILQAAPILVHRLLIGAYARSKAAATELVRQGIVRGLDGVIVYPSGIIGPQDHQASEMGRMIRGRVRKNRALTWFGFRGAYDFVDVGDVVWLLLEAADRAPRGAGYLATGHLVTIQELFLQIREALGARARIRLMPMSLVYIGAGVLELVARIFRTRPILTRYSVHVLRSNAHMESRRARDELGYSPRPLPDTIRETVEWWLRSERSYSGRTSQARGIDK